VIAIVLDVSLELTMVRNSAMHRLLRLLSLLLFTVWLPVTQHCGLEAAGLTAAQCSTECSLGQPCTKDGCAVVERASYTSGTDAIKVPTPDLNACACFLCSHLVNLETATVSAILPGESFARPRDWVLTWHFVRRAAPAPRAPSLAVA